LPFSSFVVTGTVMIDSSSLLAFAELIASEELPIVRDEILIWSSAAPAAEFMNSHDVTAVIDAP
jgi:hypothetical protein